MSGKDSWSLFSFQHMIHYSRVTRQQYYVQNKGSKREIRTCSKGVSKCIYSPDWIWEERCIGIVGEALEQQVVTLVSPPRPHTLHLHHYLVLILLHNKCKHSEDKRPVTHAVEALCPSLSPQPIMKTAGGFKRQTPASRKQSFKGQTITTSLRQNPKHLLTHMTRCQWSFSTKTREPWHYVHGGSYNLIFTFNSYNWVLGQLILLS